MAISNVSSNNRPGVCTSTTRPTAPFTGQVIFEVDTRQTLVYQGSAWVMLTDADQPPGLQLIAPSGATNGTVVGNSVVVGNAVSSVTVTDAFSATYDNYLVTISGGTGTANGSIVLQLGAAVTGYHYSFSYTNYINTPQAIGTATDTGFTYAGSHTATSLSMYCTLQNPFLTEETFVQGSTANGAFAGTMIGTKRDTTSYTDFTIKPTSGTFTGGIIRVYGYRN